MNDTRHSSKYATITSTLALVVALGGTGAYAAGAIGSAGIKNNSVKSVDLKDRGVATRDLADNAVTGRKVKNGSLRSSDFAPGEITAGTVVAYADVNENGVIQTSTIPKNITAGMITHVPGSGQYCFDQSQLDFEPGSAMVAGDNSFSVNDTIVSVLTFNTNAPPNCQVRVRTTNSAGVLTDRAFVIWFV